MLLNFEIEIQTKLKKTCWKTNPRPAARGTQNFGRQKWNLFFSNFIYICTCSVEPKQKLKTMIKKPLLFLLFFCLTAFVNQVYAQGKLQFEKETHDFGSIAQGTPVSVEFKFKNTGDQPIILSNVQASCGCTTPEWSKDPVLPGKTAVVKAGYNAAAMGAFNKSITITSNAANSTQVIFIKGTVVDKSQIKAAATPAQKAASAKASVKKKSTTSVR